MKYVVVLSLYTILSACLARAGESPVYGRRRMRQFGEQFREFDLDRNGVVDAQEIRSALGIMPTRFVDMFLKRVDVDQDGTSSGSQGYVDVQEIRSSQLDISIEYLPIVERFVITRLAEMDTNQDGMISMEEFIDGSLRKSIDD
ncbi:Guanylyl cyclase-activating protein, putative [Perkinsus marinus ATCC 50983]|uniref:Guanylyl cyclase-activating protein, putative n=1 Tax=Perkinsus marinus (strain ATCC 50983 / TXsc) TaxID=423536 RepID=C5LPJ4_PERM5|nr:Guanylyl cyclase-activating protein, putative [Perkinsus marinus ATCC 50983]EER01314.1 Guanylyl cyclase-activating protein, putative [Perkinsus marinus ATCC 50983]|eukprot:XP_002768596.1 Guanylyl cyclase-activating protein, putative [Perkinsus marinus ATCC 50983]